MRALRTATILFTDLKQMFRFALTRDLVSRNPLDLISKREVGGPAVERVRVLSKAEIEMLATALPKARLPPSIEPAVWLMLASAARLDELLGATWTDSFPNRTPYQIDHISFRHKHIPFAAVVEIGCQRQRQALWANGVRRRVETRIAGGGIQQVCT